ncbi:MAG: 30S ribosomal protein S7 [Candidatus Anoxychlamydiales bacterium]|nr:30S ribosomal protein S7 [Candidatus Anoxychlamydiales bacterium]
MRRRRAEKKKIDPDPLYKSFTVSKFINKVMLDGKKSLARKIVYQAIENLAKNVKSDNPLEAFEKALENAKPSLEIKSRRIGGATYQVPIEIAPERRETLATRWIITFSRAKVGRNMIDSLATELSDCYNNQGSTIKKKDDTHKMAEANKAFAHYKW